MRVFVAVLVVGVVLACGVSASTADPAAAPLQNAQDGPQNRLRFVSERRAKDIAMDDGAGSAKSLPLTFWRSLAHFRNSKVEKESKNSGIGLYYQNIECKWGLLGGAASKCSDLVHLDYYTLRVKKMPTGVADAPALMEKVRQILGTGKSASSIIDTSITDFTPYNDDEKKRWAAVPPMSAMMHIEIREKGINVDDATVVVIDYKKDPNEGHWTFGTWRTKLNGEHPVSGNRKFGYKKADDGEFIFYTMGADRQTGRIKNAGESIIAKRMVIDAQIKLWTSFVTRTADFINKNGGSASVSEWRAISTPFAAFWKL